jgi:tetratricopeptide (TPR) repeat protein
MITKRLAGLLVKRPSVTVGLWGSPGIGKTFVAQHLLRETACKNLSLHATTSPSSLALALPRPKKLPVWAERSLEKMGSGEFVETSAITDACGSILTGLAPFVLHLEDIHEVAPEQLEFIQNLARVVQRLKGAGLIVTSRTEPPEPFETVQLQALSSQETRLILEREASAPLPNECVDWIQTRAAGNPLYTLEFFRFLARQGFVWNDGRHWHWRTPDREIMPATVEALIEQQLRYAARTPILEAALGAKAMLPIEADQRLWETVSGLKHETLQGARVELEQQGVLLRGEFAHPLYREVARQKLSSEQRRGFARRAIERLRTKPSVEIAEFVDDADLDAPQALNLFRSALETARETGDQSLRASLLTRVVDHLRGEERADAAYHAARELRAINRVEATRFVEVTLETQPTKTEALELYAELLAGQQRLAEALQVLQRLPEDQDTSLTRSTQELFLRGMAGDSIGVLEVWGRHPELQRSTDLDLLYHAANSMSSVGDRQGTLKLCGSILERDDLDVPNRCRFANLRALTWYHQAKYHQAEASFTQALDLLSSDQTDLIARTYYLRAYARMVLGQLRDSVRDFEHAAQRYLILGNVKMYRNAQSGIGDVLKTLGEYERAEEILLECLDAQSQTGPSHALATTLHNLSVLHQMWLAPFSVPLALKYARAGLDVAKKTSNPRTVNMALVAAAGAETLAGNPTQGFALASELLELAQTPWTTSQALGEQGAALKRLGRPDEALVAYRRAYALTEASGMEVEIDALGLEIDHLLGDVVSASRRLETFRAREMKTWVDRVYRYFPQLVVTDTPLASLEAKSLLRLDFLGPMQFSLQDKPETVRGRKRQELLALLLEARIAGRAEVSKLELLEALYPDSDEDQATNALQETVRSARSSLSMDVIQTTQNGYELGAVTSDAEEFLKSGDTNLWRGAYLDGLTLETRDDTVRESLHLALFTTATRTLEMDAREAARVGRILIEFDSYNLDYLELCVKAFRATNNHKSLTRLYTDTRDCLSEVGEVIPERWQDFLERTSLRA